MIALRELVRVMLARGLGHLPEMAPKGRPKRCFSSPKFVKTGNCQPVAGSAWHGGAAPNAGEAQPFLPLQGSDNRYYHHHHPSRRQHEQHPAPSGRILRPWQDRIAFGLGFGLFTVGMIGRRGSRLGRLSSCPVPGLLGALLGLLARCLGDLRHAGENQGQTTPNSSVGGKSPRLWGGRRIRPRLGRSFKPYSGKGRPNWSELIEAVHANPAYAKHVRGED